MSEKRREYGERKMSESERDAVGMGCYLYVKELYHVSPATVTPGNHYHNLPGMW